MTPTSKKYIVKLSDDDLKRLDKILRQKNTSETLANRIRILKDMDANHPPVKTYKQCASDHGISEPTITNVVRKFVNEGLDATIKLKRSVNSDNAQRKVDGRVEAKLLEVACEPVPKGHSRWTLRLLEAQMKIILDEPISREAIRRTLKKPTSTSPQRLLVPPKERRPRIHSLHGRCSGCLWASLQSKSAGSLHGWKAISVVRRSQRLMGYVPS